MAYLVLPEEEIRLGLIRPLRTSYQHVVCGTVTQMGLSIAQTFARQPSFYTSTFCVACRGHFPLTIGDDSGNIPQFQFFWEDGVSSMEANPYKAPVEEGPKQDLPPLRLKWFWKLFLGIECIYLAACFAFAEFTEFRSLVYGLASPTGLAGRWLAAAALVGMGCGIFSAKRRLLNLCGVLFLAALALMFAVSAVSQPGHFAGAAPSPS